MKLSSKAMKQLLFLLSCSLQLDSSRAFIPQQGAWDASVRTFSTSRTNIVPPLQNSLGNKEEKNLREELARKNEEIENEEQYSIMEGITVDVDGDSNELPSPSATIMEPTQSKEVLALKQKLERVTKPRAYPLFLAETACNMAEDIAKSVFSSSDSFPYYKEDKKKLVVLGTGWGAAAFLKGIDTSKFDVTVISPRNFFLFTPMLAGASVGSVDFRSITEPVRQVSLWFTCACIYIYRMKKNNIVQSYKRYSCNDYFLIFSIILNNRSTPKRTF